MRNTFRQYFSIPEPDLVELWQHGLFSFDASVLLNIYGYSVETRDELLNVIKRNAARIRLPHQFAIEYARNRHKVIIKQVSKYQEVERELEGIKRKYFEHKREHPYLTKKSLNAYCAIERELEASRKKMEKLIGSDRYADLLLEVFEGKIGPAPNPEELSQLCSDGEERFKKQIPPGFRDMKEKDSLDAYGDYIGWHQLMAIAQAEQKDFILVIDDFKEDWWLLEHGRTIGPRPELRQEFTRVTQRQIHLYNSENFLRAAKKFNAADVSDEVIEEVTERLESQREIQRVTNLKDVPSESLSHVTPASENKIKDELKSESPTEVEKSQAKQDLPK